jgi:hypothetical protein
MFDIIWLDEDNDGYDYWNEIFSTDLDFITKLYDNKSFKCDRITRYKSDNKEYDTVKLYNSSLKELTKYILSKEWEPMGQTQISSSNDDDPSVRYIFKKKKTIYEL